MDITIRQLGSVTILDLAGRLTKDSSDGRLRLTATQKLSGGSEHILLNMGGLTLMDSSGLGELTAVKQAASRIGAAVKLLHVEDKVLNVLKLAGMAGAFEIFDDEATAVRSFR